MTDLDQVHRRRWFYEFQLPDGTATTTDVPDDVVTIHPARLEMVRRVVGRTFGDDLSAVDAIDFACHQGWFTTKLLDDGVRSVHSVDVRPEHLEDAALITRVLGYEEPRTSFQRFDVGDPQSYPLEGEYDLVLMLGLIYHLENPLGALRVARRHARRLCLVETQIAPSIEGVTEWGSHRWTKEIAGSFVVVDETDELASENREANTASISLFPDINGLVYLMRAVGFDRVEIVEPTDLNEQLARGKRAMAAGWVD